MSESTDAGAGGAWDTFHSIVDSRISCRGFRPDPVPEALLQQVFATAQRSPSNCNTQPWLTWVVSGERRDALAETITTRFMAGDFSMDFPYDGSYEGVYRDRQYGAANALYAAQGITREDKVARNDTFMRNFRFFDAPHVAFLFLPEPFGLREAADLGMYAQTLMLSLQAAGLGSCPQTALSFQADTVREALGIAANNKLLFGISFGYADEDHPANRCRTDRAALPDCVQFVS